MHPWNEVWNPTGSFQSPLPFESFDIVEETGPDVPSLASTPATTIEATPNAPSTLASETLRPAPLVEFDLLALTSELLWHYDAISYDSTAINIFEKITTLIYKNEVPARSLVESLVLRNRGRFYCPFEGCKKKKPVKGWDCIRNGRDPCFSC